MEEFSQFSTGTSIVGIIIIIAVCVGVFLLLREFFCWYYKINRHIHLMEDLIDEQKKTNEKLTEAIKKLENNH